MDQINWGILQELQKNARIPFAEIGRKVGLTSPAVAERVKKMEDTGIINGYYTSINHQKNRLSFKGHYYASSIYRETEGVSGNGKNF